MIADPLRRAPPRPGYSRQAAAPARRPDRHRCDPREDRGGSVGEGLRGREGAQAEAPRLAIAFDFSRR